MAKPPVALAVGLAVAAGCSGSSSAPAAGSGSPAIVDGRPPTPDAGPPPDPRRWLAGDVHVHVAPPDTAREVSSSIETITAAARAAHLDFVVLTPHLRESSWASRRGERRAAWGTFAERARGVSAPTLIPGAEWTTRRGHFTVAGIDIAAIDQRDFLAAADAAGALITVNHPFAEPSHIPGVPISEVDMSYRVWTDHAAGFTAIDGAEVWNVPLAVGDLFSHPAGPTGETRAWTELDRIVHAERRPMIAVGGSDDHHGRTQPTTWVLAADSSEAAILAGLRAGATCVGGPEAGTLRARGDGDWVAIGGTVTGPEVTLAFTGDARVYVDDHDAGVHHDRFVHTTGGTLHTYRIQIEDSRSGFVYANL